MNTDNLPPAEVRSFMKTVQPQEMFILHIPVKKLRLWIWIGDNWLSKQTIYGFLWKGTELFGSIKGVNFLECVNFQT
jgi:hypothetical protein